MAKANLKDLKLNFFQAINSTARVLLLLRTPRIYTPKTEITDIYSTIVLLFHQRELQGVSNRRIEIGDEETVASRECRFTASI